MYIAHIHCTRYALDIFLNANMGVQETYTILPHAITCTTSYVHQILQPNKHISMTQGLRVNCTKQQVTNDPW